MALAFFPPLCVINGPCRSHYTLFFRQVMLVNFIFCVCVCHGLFCIC